MKIEVPQTIGMYKNSTAVYVDQSLANTAMSVLTNDNVGSITAVENQEPPS